MRCHVSTRMAIIKKTDNYKWRNLNPNTLPVGIQNGAATLENSMAAPQKIKHRPYDPEIVLLDKYPREMETNVHAKTCTQMLITALFLITKK